MKKILLTAVSVVLVAALAIAGTLAFFTDRDAKTNVFTVGNVDITLNDDFVQGSQLIPGVDIKKDVTVTNTGKNDAWVWVEIAIPQALDDATDASKNIVHFNMTSESLDVWTWTKDDAWMIDTATIDTVEYNVYTVAYKNVLKASETTAHSAMYKVYLDTHVDIDPEGNLYWVENGNTQDLKWNVNTMPKMHVSAYAIQEENFDDVYAAMDAYGVQWGANGGAEYVEPKNIQVTGTDKASLVTAIKNAEDGDIITLEEDTIIAGYAAADKLVVEKAVTINLDGNAITTESGWGGIDLKGGASIINGTINHTGNTAAIKAFQVGAIENVTINVAETAGKTKAGIAIQSGDSYVGSIKNVTINGATNGIECYRTTSELAIGSMENVKINATSNGIFLNGAGRIGSMVNCDITGGNIGIQAYLANLWHISLDIKDSTIKGGTTGIDIWDEGATNTGSTVVFNYDADTVFEGSRENIKITLQDEITCTVNGADQATPCDVRK